MCLTSNREMTFDNCAQLHASVNHVVGASKSSNRMVPSRQSEQFKVHGNSSP